LGSLNNLKPGQTKITPSPGNGDRVFYETLLEQNPDSEMAQDWCSTHGVLEEKEAAKLLNSESFSCWEWGVVDFSHVFKSHTHTFPYTLSPPPEINKRKANPNAHKKPPAAAAAAAAPSSKSSGRGSKKSYKDPDDIAMDVDEAGAGWEGRGTVGV